MAEPQAGQSDPRFGRIRMLAHDLANLLTVLEGSIELSQRHAVDNPALARLLANMRQATERADTIAQQLRELGSSHGHDRPVA